ncbi:hypothetical protein COCOBI_10-3780 [Coccomyxa sp. Obi]|nr:hypothetical protein COCOBI_10-3780 [Coccomyxa sp. Obi]
MCRCSTEGQSPPEGTALASEFSRHVNTAGLRSPLEHRGPTPMLSPCAVVAAQLDALQMNDWPETDAGVRTAFLFSKPYDCENMIAGRATPSECHSWMGTETWVPFKEFSNALHSPPQNVLLNCESWRAISKVVFPSSRSGNKAVQAVEVQALQQKGEARLRPYVFTFCLERVDVGPYKGCWMTVGLRCGNYSV